MHWTVYLSFSLSTMASTSVSVQYVHYFLSFMYFLSFLSECLHNYLPLVLSTQRQVKEDDAELVVKDFCSGVEVQNSTLDILESLRGTHADQTDVMYIFYTNKEVCGLCRKFSCCLHIPGYSIC